MDGTEKVVKHLEMTQAIINRLGSNSFQLKGWSMILIEMTTYLCRRLKRKTGIPAQIDGVQSK